MIRAIGKWVGRCIGLFSIFGTATIFAYDDFEQSSFIMGALGDSVSTGVNANGWGASLESNWSTGSHINSHYQRLKAQVGEDLQRINVAQGGATSQSLDAQITKLLNQARPDYVTLLLGANDVCSWHDSYETKIAAYSAKMRNGIKRLTQANPQIKIQMVPIPNLFRVWEVGRRNGCQWFWDMTNICSGVFHSSRSPAERQEFVAVTMQTNASLQSIADEFAENIRFDQSLVDVPIAWQDISSYDCFHPSVKGQNLIAEKTWASGWYH